MKIKISSADYYFSLCVRERSDWTCEKCGTRYQPDYNLNTGLPGTRALHCSHFFGRTNHAVRFYSDDVDAHCYGCHTILGSNHHAFVEWKKERLGEERYARLVKRSNDIELGKRNRRELKQISKHFKKEFQKMQESRNSGKKGRIEFQDYESE